MQLKSQRVCICTCVEFHNQMLHNSYFCIHFIIVHCKTVCIYTTSRLFPYAVYTYTTNFIQKTQGHEQPLQLWRKRSGENRASPRPGCAGLSSSGSAELVGHKHREGRAAWRTEAALRMTAYSHCLWENCSLRWGNTRTSVRSRGLWIKAWDANTRENHPTCGYKL